MRKIPAIYQLMVYIALVLLVFYPTQFAEICNLDDADAIAEFFSQEYFDLKSVFFPRSVNGGYYRPFIFLSYVLDKKMWFLDEHIMHFESVAWHLINGGMVFLICKTGLRLHQKVTDSYLPLAAALVFALHPVVTESVNWISGRTDIMMSTFLLLNIICVLKLIESGHNAGYWVVFVLSMCCALFSKESAFGYLAGSVLFLSLRRDESNSRNGLIYVCSIALSVVEVLLLGSYWIVVVIAFALLVYEFGGVVLKETAAGRSNEFSRLLWLMGAGIASIVVFALSRKVLFVSSVSKIGQTINLMLADTNYTISVFLGAVGYYVKKFFMPLPLNFHIAEIDPLYDFTGIIVLFLAVRLLIVRTLPAIFALLGLCMLLPVLPFALGTIAWTAYAERYIYLSSALWVISAALYCGKQCCNTPRRSAVVIVLIVLLGGVTFKRNLVWQTNESLMADTVSQSPSNRKLHDKYIYALMSHGKTTAAEKQYHTASRLKTSYHDEGIDLIIAGNMAKEGRSADALSVYLAALQKSQFSSETLLDATLHHVSAMIAAKRAEEQNAAYQGLYQTIADKLYSTSRNPRLLMRGGELTMKMGDSRRAYDFFDKALQFTPPSDSRYILLKRLKQNAGGTIS